MCQYIHRSPHSCRPPRRQPRHRPAPPPGACRARPGGCPPRRCRVRGIRLIGALDAVADLAGELGVPAGVPQRDLVAPRPRPRAARGRTRRSSAASGACRPGRPPARAPCRRATPARRGRSRRGRRRRPRRPRACTLRRRRPCAGTGAAPTPQERVAPVDRGAQCLLPLGSVARTGREHVEGMVEPLEQRLGGQEPQPGGGELERERQAVEAPADRRDGPGILGRQLERASRRRARSTNSATAGYAMSDSVESVSDAEGARAARAGTPVRRRS